MTEVLIEESVLGWKEFELELMRDHRDNVVVVCSIENLDPMGVHTGDSITVAPAMTLTDREYQHMRDVGIAVLRAVGVDTGGCNIQFAVHPETGRLVVIEMNPRVSRSSALASKATGFPIAKIAARLAVGYTLDEIRNDITGETIAAFEPTLDYVVVKIPRFAFEKFPGADPELTTTMKSVGEAMALGRSFPEALGKALRSMETPAAGFWTPSRPGRRARRARRRSTGGSTRSSARCAAAGPSPTSRPSPVWTRGSSTRSRCSASCARSWRRRRCWTPTCCAARSGTGSRTASSPSCARSSPARTACGRCGTGSASGRCSRRWTRAPRSSPRARRTTTAPTRPTPPPSPRSRRRPSKPKVLILGSGPNRIGQGIEFDYSCVHAVMALREAGFETVMVNCNPETVSTDYDTADRLYFEPLTFEDVLEVVYSEQASGTVAGVIVQLGGQTPLGLAQRLTDAGVPVVGTSAAAIDLAEDRGAFGEVLRRAKLPAPDWGMATSFESAREIASRIGYPVLVRPSYVLGGRGMEIVYDESSLAGYIARATTVSPDRPVLVDNFLDDAIEIDVDALCDGEEVFLGGVMEHIEEAGVHSGDSSCTLPPITLGRSVLEQVRSATEAIAHGVGVRGLLNVQYALHGDVLYVLEANPRASRTVPFVSKATAVPLAKAAARIMLGATIKQLRTEGLLPADGDGGRPGPDAPVAVKEAVLPFNRFRTKDGQGVDPLLGPEMKSTGEVMGFDASFGPAFAKSQSAAYGSLPTSGSVFVSIADRDKRAMMFPVRRLADIGFRVLATEGTAEVLRRNGISVDVVRKHSAGSTPENPTVVDTILAGEVDLILNTPVGNPGPRVDGYEIRAAAVSRGVPCITTVQGAAAAVQGIEALISGGLDVRSLQQAHAALAGEPEAPALDPGPA